MGDPRIIDVTLDDRTIIWRNADIEQERRVAIFDLLEQNHFAPNGHEGPFRILLRVEDNRPTGARFFVEIPVVMPEAPTSGLEATIESGARA